MNEALFSMLGGAAGAAITSLLALDHFRDQRSWDRRAEWFERSILALRRMELLLNDISTMLSSEMYRRGEITEKINAAMVSRRKQLSEVVDALVLAAMYAPGVDVVRPIEQYDALTTQVNTFADQGQNAPASVFAEQAAYLGLIAQELTDAARAHLNDRSFVQRTSDRIAGFFHRPTKS